MMIYNNLLYYDYTPPIADIDSRPPTIYAILNSCLNYGKSDSEKTKIANLAAAGRSFIFDFDYPLTENVSKEYFETLILNHYLMRRIGFETLTAFKIYLSAKLNEIMPYYNKLFDALQNWNIFSDGESLTREGTNVKDSTAESINLTSSDNKSTTSNKTKEDKRFSDLPQSRLDDLEDASYVTEANLNQNTSESNDNSSSNVNSNGNSKSNDNTNYKETISRTQGDRIEIYRKMQSEINSIYTLIFKDLDGLFYLLA